MVTKPSWSLNKGVIEMTRTVKKNQDSGHIIQVK
jgi:hypothetical protein